jgi:hypothetical protein
VPTITIFCSTGDQKSLYPLLFGPCSMWPRDVPTITIFCSTCEVPRPLGMWLPARFQFTFSQWAYSLVCSGPQAVFFYGLVALPALVPAVLLPGYPKPLRALATSLILFIHSG